MARSPANDPPSPGPGSAAWSAGAVRGRKSVLERLLDLLYPPRCAFCGGLLGDGEWDWCRACAASLPWIGPEAAEKSCPPVTRCVAPLWYHDEVREPFLRYKFEGRTLYAPVYGRLMAQCVRERMGPDFDLVCWAPLSSRRRRERGYDQAELLARTLAEELDRPVVPALEKVRDTVAQSSLKDESERMRNAAASYRCRDPALVADKVVLLADDIVTTGATLSSCARVLLKAGAREVRAVAFARAQM